MPVLLASIEQMKHGEAGGCGKSLQGIRDDLPTSETKWNSVKPRLHGKCKGKILHAFSRSEEDPRRSSKIEGTKVVQNDEPCWEVYVCLALPD